MIKELRENMAKVARKMIKGLREKMAKIARKMIKGLHGKMARIARRKKVKDCAKRHFHLKNTDELLRTGGGNTLNLKDK